MQDNIKELANSLKDIMINPEDDNFERFQSYASKKRKKHILYIYSSVVAAIVLLCIMLYGPLKDRRNPILNDLCVNNSCLCDVSFNLLQEKGYRLKEIQVEEDCVDNCTDCESGKWYESEKYKGLTLQRAKYNTNEIIRVRFTKDYRGKVPGGDYVNLNRMQLRELKILADSKTWFAQECYNYITFSNGDIRILLKSEEFNETGLVDIEHNSYSWKTIEAIEIFNVCRENQMANLYLQE